MQTSADQTVQPSKTLQKEKAPVAEPLVKKPKIEDSDYVKAWKALPKDKRDKLTKK